MTEVQTLRMLVENYEILSKHLVERCEVLEKTIERQREIMYKFSAENVRLWFQYRKGVI